MTSALRIPFVVLLAFSSPFLGTAADPQADPLPQGATLRLGSDRMRGFSFGSVLTPDGKYLTATHGGKSVLIDVTTGREAGTLPGPVSTFSADGKWSANAHRNVMLTDHTTGKQRQVSNRYLPINATSPVSLSADGKLLAIGAYFPTEKGGPPLTAILWDVQANKQLLEVTVIQNTSVNVRLSPDGKTLATYGMSTAPPPKPKEKRPDIYPTQIVQLWDTTDGKLLGRANVAGYNLIDAAFSPDSSLLAISGGDGVILVRDARTGAAKRQLFGQTNTGRRLVFSPDGNILASASGDNRIQRWTVSDGRILDVIKLTDGSPSGVGFQDIVFTSPDRAVVLGGRGSRALVWEIPSGKLLSPLDDHSSAIASIGFTPDGKQIVTSGYQSELCRWNAATGERMVQPILGQPSASGSTIPTIRVTPDGSRGMSVISTSVYDLATGLELFPIPPTRSDLSTISYIARTSHDGTKALIRSAGNNKLKTDLYSVWDVVDVKKLGDVETGKLGNPLTVELSTDGTKLLFFNRDAGDIPALTGWDVPTGKQLGKYPVPEGLQRMATVPGGEPLALVLIPNEGWIVLDYAAGKKLRSINLNRESINAGPVFAQDGKSFALASWNLTDGQPPEAAEVYVYDWPSGELRHTFRGHWGQVTSLAFSPNGKMLATGSTDTTVLLWDLCPSPSPRRVFIEQEPCLLKPNFTRDACTTRRRLAPWRYK